MKIKIEIEEGEQMSAGINAFDPNNVKCPNCGCESKLDASVDTYE